MTARQRLLGRKSAGSIIDLRTEATQLLLSLAKVLNTTTDGMSPEELGPRDLLLNFFVVHGHAFSASQKVGIGLCFWSCPDFALGHNWVADLLSNHATETYSFGFRRITTERNTHVSLADNRTGQSWEATVARINQSHRWCTKTVSFQ